MTRSEQAVWRQIDVAQVKGKWEPVSVFELPWRSDGDTTLMLEPWTTQARPAGTLMLALSDKVLELSEAHPSLTIGRGEENDLVVPLRVVSRLHARLEHRNGRFVLSDMSANGTFLVDPNGALSFLRRESRELVGCGTVMLGNTDGPHIVYYADLAP
jgi:adenylate cyclase